MYSLINKTEDKMFTLLTPLRFNSLIGVQCVSVIHSISPELDCKKIQMERQSFDHSVPSMIFPGDLTLGSKDPMSGID